MFYSSALALFFILYINNYSKANPITKFCILLLVCLLQDVRKQLYALLKVKVPTYDWDGIIKQTGMFYYSKLTYKQGIDLMKKHHVYMLPSSGRINLGAVTHKNAEKVANALADVVLNS